jgi:hypothetical protein
MRQICERGFACLPKLRGSTGKMAAVQGTNVGPTEAVVEGQWRVAIG